MRLRLLAGAIVVCAGMGLAAASCGDDDEAGCAGEILGSCSDCECPSGQQTRCTAYPEGDQSSRERCCVCE